MIKHIVTLVVLTFLSFTGLAAADPVDELTERSALSPGEIDTYTVYLKGGEITRLFVRGDGDGDIDCVILDDDGDVVAADNGSSDVCDIYYAPARTGRFTVAIGNAGRVTDIYRLRLY